MIHKVSELCQKIDGIKKVSYLDFYTYSRLNYSYIGFNMQKAPFKNKYIRQAMNHAINKQTIIDSILRGYGQVAHIPSNPLSWAYPNASELHTFDYNINVAKALIEKAGYTLNVDTNQYEKNNTPLSFKLLLSQGSKEGERIAQIVQRFLSLVGVNMSIQIMEWSSLLKTIHSKVLSILHKLHCCAVEFLHF